MKTILLFSLIILLGLVGVLVANSFEGGDAEVQKVPSSVGCLFRDC